MALCPDEVLGEPLVGILGDELHAQGLVVQAVFDIGKACITLSSFDSIISIGADLYFIVVHWNVGRGLCFLQFDPLRSLVLAAVRVGCHNLLLVVLRSIVVVRELNFNATLSSILNYLRLHWATLTVLNLGSARERSLLRLIERHNAVHIATTAKLA